STATIRPPASRTSTGCRGAAAPSGTSRTRRSNVIVINPPRPVCSGQCGRPAVGTPVPACEAVAPGRSEQSVNLAEQVVQVLVQAGVERVYGVVGDSLNAIVDAIRRTEGIEWIQVHHEEAGAFAAAAEAQVTGRLAVCAGSCGPGNTHLLQGLYDANRSGAPVLAIASHIHTDQIGTSFFQETHPERLFVDASV